MAAFGKKSEVTIPQTPEESKEWGWEPHETITIKGQYTLGDAAVSGAVNNQPDAIKSLLTMIVRWTLTDDQGRNYPVTEASVAALPINYATPVFNEITKIMGVGAIPDPLPLSNSSNALISMS